MKIMHGYLRTATFCVTMVVVIYLFQRVIIVRHILLIFITITQLLYHLYVDVTKLLTTVGNIYKYNSESFKRLKITNLHSL